MRPSPTSPHACAPESGPSTDTPSARSCAALRWPGFATSGGSSRERRAAGNRARRTASTADRPRTRARASREIRRRGRDHDRIGFARQVDVRHVVVDARVPLARVTGRPDSACIVTGVMNWVAASVIATCTVAPAFTSSRVARRSCSRRCRPSGRERGVFLRVLRVPTQASKGQTERPARSRPSTPVCALSASRARDAVRRRSAAPRRP